MQVSAARPRRSGKGTEELVVAAQGYCILLTNFQPSASHSQAARSPYFLLFASDADRELKIPIHNAAAYRNLDEGRPARLRECKVMIRVFDRAHWFLVRTRYSGEGAVNHSIGETMGFSWNGPLTVMRLEGRTPAGIISSEHHQAAIAAVEQ